MGFSKNHIDVIISEEGVRKYRLIGLYGEPNRSLRRETWELIRHLGGDSDLPWCLVGDLNNVISQADKRGGNPTQIGL